MKKALITLLLLLLATPALALDNNIGPVEVGIGASALVAKIILPENDGDETEVVINGVDLGLGVNFQIDVKGAFAPMLALLAYPVIATQAEDEADIGFGIEFSPIKLKISERIAVRPVTFGYAHYVKAGTDVLGFGFGIDFTYTGKKVED